MTQEVYKKLAKHLAAMGMGYPEKEELIEILQARKKNGRPPSQRLQNIP